MFDAASKAWLPLYFCEPHEMPENIGCGTTAFATDALFDIWE